ncbi:Uncharacterised protein [Chlamydia trachomatis]|nr:Uncharacterised protein [Chlamydia trachomatis]
MKPVAGVSEALIKGAKALVMSVGISIPNTGLTSHQKMIAKKLGINAIKAFATMGGTLSGSLMVSFLLIKKR